MKQNPKITEDLGRELIQMRGDYEACREIATLKDHPGWTRLRAILLANKEALKVQREDFQKINEHGLRFILKEEQDLDFFLGLVDGVAARMEKLENEISETQATLNERKRAASTSADPTAGV